MNNLDTSIGKIKKTDQGREEKQRPNWDINEAIQSRKSERKH
jgi:hypothetical protein